MPFLLIFMLSDGTECGPRNLSSGTPMCPGSFQEWGNVRAHSCGGSVIGRNSTALSLACSGRRRVWGGLPTICPGSHPGLGGCRQAFALARLRHFLVRAADVVRGSRAGSASGPARTGWRLGRSCGTLVSQWSQRARWWTSRPSLQTWRCQPPETSTRHGPASVQDTMDATHYLFWTLHLHQVGGLQEAELVVST